MAKATMSRSELIASLKAKRVKGALSKMRKADLHRMLTEHGGAGQHGGHGYKVDGALGKGEADKYKHVHGKKSFPAGAQAGSGLSYRQFVAREAKNLGANPWSAAGKQASYNLATGVKVMAAGAAMDYGKSVVDTVQGGIP